MRVIDGFEIRPLPEHPVVTVGSFDGVHAGHRALLAQVVGHARAASGQSVVVTFVPHPRQVLGGGDGVRLLNTLAEKRRLLASVGVDLLVEAPFTEQFSRLSSEEFVRDCLIGGLGMAKLCVGYDHRFGHDRQGGYDAMHALAERYGFGIVRLARQDVGGDRVSSTVVRRLIAQGRMDEAARLLATPYPLEGGCDARGYIRSDEEAKLLPPPGSYPVRIMELPDGVPTGGVLTVGEGDDPRLDMPERWAGRRILVEFC